MRQQSLLDLEQEAGNALAKSPTPTPCPLNRSVGHLFAKALPTQRMLGMSPYKVVGALALIFTTTSKTTPFTHFFFQQMLIEVGRERWLGREAIQAGLLEGSTRWM